MKYRHHKTAVASILALMLAVAPGQIVGVANAADSPEAFVRKAGLSNTFEVEAAKLALTRGKAPDAKTFAADMIKDHTAAGAALAKAAAEQGIEVPKQLDREHGQKLEALKAATDADFDQAYLSTQVSAHEEAVALFDDYIKHGSGGPLGAFAESTLGTLRTHNVRIHGLTHQ